MADTVTPSALQPWAPLVLKDGVALGGLSRPELLAALALAWAALPAGRACNEREINEHLKAVLAGPALCLGTDHVELRRWLVDAGWLQRDGYGREYRVPPWAVLAPDLQALAAPLRGVDVARWVAGQRQARLDAREARRREWQARQAAA
jgi:Uncharacterized protein conserved in bacteria (DUF2087)